MRPRHSDAHLLGLAREGSDPAFASLLHRHRDVIQRGAVRAERPEKVAESVMVAAMRDLRRGRLQPVELRDRLDTLVEEQVRRAPGTPGVERLLPNDWFDRAWVRAARAWPNGRRRPQVGRWVWQLGAAIALALSGAGMTYLIITADATTEVITELIAEPIEDPDMLVVPGPVTEAEPEEAPELFGDVELGELPTYDLTGQNDRARPDSPTIGPDERGDAGSIGGDDDGPGVRPDGVSEPRD